MKAMVRTFCAGVILLYTPWVLATYDAEVAITEQTLNNIVDTLGKLSDSGFYQPMRHVLETGFEFCQPVDRTACSVNEGSESGLIQRSGAPLVLCTTQGNQSFIVPVMDPIYWHWWISNVRFSIRNSKMFLDVNLTAMVGEQETVFQKQIPASLVFNEATDQIRIKISKSKATLTTRAAGRIHTLTEINFDRLFSLSVPIESQLVTVPQLNGGSNVHVTSFVRGLEGVAYDSDAVVARINVGFRRD